VMKLRYEAQRSLKCCKLHGDDAMVPERYEHQYQVKFGGGSGNTIPMHRVAMTQGLARYIDEFEQNNGTPSENCAEKTTLTPGVTTICRLHGQDRCRFGHDCKFVHICKELMWAEVSGAGHSRRHTSNATPPSQHHNQYQWDPHGMPPSPMGPYATGSNARSYYSPAHMSHMSNDSLISMDLTATPPMTPTQDQDPMISPVIKSRDAGDSWSYEPYNFNPIPMMPPAMTD